MAAKPKKRNPAPAAAPAPMPVQAMPTAGRNWRDIVNVLNTLLTCEDEEREFFHDLMEKWTRGAWSLPEAALMLSAKRLGYGFLNDDTIANPPYKCSERLGQAYKALFKKDDGWFSDFLSTLLFEHDRNGKVEPHDVVAFLQTAIAEYKAQMDATHDLLRDCPEKFADEIRAAIKAHPELVTPAE